MEVNMARIAASLLCFCLVLPAMAAERWDVGLATNGARIEAAVVAGASATSPTVLLIGGLNGNGPATRLVTEEARAFDARSQANRPFRLVAIALANPEASRLVFPPAGTAYRENTESHVLWRWIAMQAPDLVLVAGTEDYGLSEALSGNVVAGVGRIPTERVPLESGMLQRALRLKEIPRSEARREIERRRSRSPRQLAEELARHYGHEFDQLTYIPGMSLIGRLRLGHVPDVQKIVAKWVDGPRSGNLAGYLVFAELAARTSEPRYREMVLAAASVGFTEAGEMKESMPANSEMSDSVFMSIPILGKASKLTGDRKYCDMASRHLTFMQKLDLRPDGLYRHSPTSSNVAWGRGNAFPALGIALTLSDCPTDHPAFNPMLRAFQQHIATLAPFQDPHGLWHQVIDEPGSYAEFTATAMIGISMLRGVRNGWLDAATYQPRIDKAWQAILARVGNEGQLVDVCESTNKQATLKDYLHREAILGRDIRGGGMALIFATEMAGLQ
jgi:unsaturated rhamnogalacturonyl hydrolase